MEYIRKLITLPEELAERLGKEGNQSATVAEALERHYQAKDTVRQLISLQEEIRQALNGVDDSSDKSYRLLKQIAVAMRNQGADINV